MYARLYSGILNRTIPPQDTRLDWRRMRVSLQDLVKRYPTDYYRHLAGTFACVYQDAEFYKELIRSDESLQTAAFVGLAAFERCRDWLSTVAR